MDNELLHCGIENRTPCLYSSRYLSIFLSFKAKFVSQFSLELCKLESSNMVYICRMRDCIVGLRLRVMAFFSIFHPFFFLSQNYKLTFKIRVGVFSGTFKARMLKLVIHMNNELLDCGIEIGLLAYILSFICPFSRLLRLNLCHSFLPSCAIQTLQIWYTYEE